MKKSKNWTREELVLAINLYCKTPFGKIHNRNPDIIQLARIINRTSNSISYKLANFASIDPSLPRKGASNVSKLDVVVWNEFFNDWEALVLESEKIIGIYNEKEVIDIGDKDSNVSMPIGIEKERLVKTRVNQTFFRKTILASCDNKCCITGISTPELLIASHIVPWALDKKNRLNPRNGVCLNSLHDKAFDKGLITITSDFAIQLSSELKDLNNDFMYDFFIRFENKKIELPKKFLPDPSFLAYHKNNIFKI